MTCKSIAIRWCCTSLTNIRVHDLTTHIVNPWDLTFFREFPHQQTSYVESGKSIIAEFACLAKKNHLCPDVSDGLEVLMDQIIRTENILKSQTEFSFEEITMAVRKAHKEAVPAIRQFLEPMYSKCAAEGGQQPPSFHCSWNVTVLITF
jgi:hypothetical protein